jgi:hypothetical protein
MPPTTPPLDFDHKPGYEIPTKHKEAICQLYGSIQIPIEGLMERYHLGRTIEEFTGQHRTLPAAAICLVCHKRGILAWHSNY